MTDKKSKFEQFKRRAVVLAAAGITSFAAFVGNATAQNVCDSDLVDEVLEPVLQAIFQIGPLLAAIGGVASLVMMSQVTSKDKKKKWKERRNDAFLYGVVGVLVVGFIIDFLVNDMLSIGDGDVEGDCLEGVGIPGLSDALAHGVDVAAALV